MNKVQLSLFFDRYLLYLQHGFPSDEAMALAEGRFADYNAGAQRDYERERDEGWSK